MYLTSGKIIFRAFIAGMMAGVLLYKYSVKKLRELKDKARA